MLEMIEAAAAFFGAATGLLFLIERGSQHYPLMIITARPSLPGGRGERFPFLTIKNRSNRPLLLELPVGTKPGHFRASPDDSIRGIVAGIVRSKLTVVLEVDEQRDFPLHKPVDFVGLDTGTYMRAVMHWRHAQPIRLIGNRRSIASITKADYILLTGGEDLEGG